MKQLEKDLTEVINMLQGKVKMTDLFKDEDDPKGVAARVLEVVVKIQDSLKINTLKELAHPNNKVLQEGLMSSKLGTLVKIRPVDDEYKDKTFVGFYLGELATSFTISITDDKIQLNFAGHNPAIFVPDLGKIIYGYESWWGKIDSIDDLKSITDKDIDDIWYMKLFKSQLEDETRI